MVNWSMVFGQQNRQTPFNAKWDCPWVDNYLLFWSIFNNVFIFNTELNLHLVLSSLEKVHLFSFLSPSKGGNSYVLNKINTAILKITGKRQVNNFLKLYFSKSII